MPMVHFLIVPPVYSLLRRKGEGSFPVFFTPSHGLISQVAPQFNDGLCIFKAVHGHLLIQQFVGESISIFAEDPPTHHYAAHMDIDLALTLPYAPHIDNVPLSTGLPHHRYAAHMDRDSP